MRTLFACGCLVVPLVVWSGVASAQTPLVPVHEAWVRTYPDVDTCVQRQLFLPVSDNYFYRWFPLLLEG
jgi:hypothetical protein